MTPSKTILIIDDEPLVRRSILRAIRARGHQGLEAADGPSGLNLWLQARPHIVIVDILMPGLSGPDVIRMARTAIEGQAAEAILLISAFSGEDSERLAIDVGADRFLSKPFDDILAVIDLGLSLAEDPTKANDGVGKSR